MSTLASAVIAKAWQDLNDDGTTWLSAEMLGHLNDAQVVAAIIKPEVCTTQESITLVEGTRQTLPATAISLVRPVRNLTAAGAFGRAPIFSTSPQTMDGLLPDWHSRPAKKEIRYVLYDPSEPKVFFVYPPQPASTDQKLDAVLANLPTTIATTSTAITLADELVPALIDYLLYRAFAKDVEVPEMAARSQNALASFAAKLGVSLAAARAALAQHVSGGVK